MRFRVIETVTNREGDVVEIPQGPATTDMLTVIHSLVSALSLTQDRDPVLDRVFTTNRIVVEFIPDERPPWEDWDGEPPF